MSALARWCYQHRLLVIAVWIGVLVGLAGISQAVKTTYDNSFTLPGTGSGSAQELLDFHDKMVADAKEVLGRTSDETMMESWTMRNGETVYFTMPKVQVLRSMVFNHIIHHRGQLSVYLRENDIPVPSIYGPSADEPM